MFEQDKQYGVIPRANVTFNISESLFRSTDKSKKLGELSRSQTKHLLSIPEGHNVDEEEKQEIHHSLSKNIVKKATISELAHQLGGMNDGLQDETTNITYNSNNLPRHQTLKYLPVFQESPINREKLPEGQRQIYYQVDKSGEEGSPQNRRYSLLQE
eukprot:CAMPEP_0202964662 /NCGR_PEP_ID=MMETSP1396-20130829/8740_1 /ASSEMBLY_ACC=CAM_ASM_000872 /TAXON_ID= /ORGANISM="Pseudokeronopsis sp., Strain Brazil" /LENGTH=156 /DNA_ID=CAMNT_0049686919 /DNA_START=1371 /DNA_END=1841 /DNA_ORIENTATION=-